MTTIFTERQTAASRSDWESGLLAKAIIDQVAHDDPRLQKGLLKVWLPGMFAAAATDIHEGVGAGFFEWTQSGPASFDLVWHAPYGAGLKLARTYRQPDGSWASLVIAGVKNDPAAAMAAAEWAIGRLSAAT